MPIFEPNLDQMMKKVIGKNLEFTDDINIALEHPDILFLALPTPTKTEGENAGKAYDLFATETAIRNIVKFYNRNPSKLSNKMILVEKSTVPIGTSKMIETLISQVSIE